MENLINSNFKILWAEVQAHPAEQPPFRLRVGIQSTQESGLFVLSDSLIHGCISLEDCINKFEIFVEKSNMIVAKDFALIYPMFPVPASLEPSLHYIASMVFEIAQAKKWGYERKLPIPIWWE